MDPHKEMKSTKNSKCRGKETRFIHKAQYERDKVVKEEYYI